MKKLDYGIDKGNLSQYSWICHILSGMSIHWNQRLKKKFSFLVQKQSMVYWMTLPKEKKMVAQLLESVNVEVQIPGIFNVDDVWAIGTTENTSATVMTCHIDTQYHFVRERIEDSYN